MASRRRARAAALWLLHSAGKGEGEKLSSETAPRRDALGRFAARPVDDVEAIRRDYEESNKTRAQICADHNISPPALQRVITQGIWRRRAPRRVDPNDLMMRMFVVLGDQLTSLEKDMTKSGTAEAAVLGKLATTLDRLIAIKRAEAKHQPRQQSREIDELRSKIAERIAELNAA